MKPEFFRYLPDYKKKYLFNDLMSGLLVAIIALPLSIALGIQSVPEDVSGNGIQMGLITAIVAGFLISFLGGSRMQIGGPTAAFVVILFAYIADPEIGIIGLQFATILAGVWLVVFSLVRAGNIMKYIPYPIVVGFTTGIGLTLIVGQIKDLFGLNASGSELIEKLVSYYHNITDFNWLTFLIGCLGLAIILILNKINKKIPAAIIALITCTGVNLIISYTVGDMGVQTIGSKYGEINAEFYPIDFSKISSLKIGKIIIPSFSIAFLCAIESLLSATVADGMAKTKHNPNQELFGQGIANIGSALLGGLPATGAIARTAANINAGAKSPLSGMFHGLFILIMYFSLMSVIRFIPLTVFSAILITVAIHMCNFPLFFKFIKFSKRDSAIVLSTCLLTLFLDLIYGVIGGMIISTLLNIPSFRKRMTIERKVDEILTIKVKGSIYVFNVDTIIKTVQERDAALKRVVIDFSEVSTVDATACERLGKLKKSLQTSDNTLDFTNVSEKTAKRIYSFQSL